MQARTSVASHRGEIADREHRRLLGNGLATMQCDDAGPQSRGDRGNLRGFGLELSPSSHAAILVEPPAARANRCR